MIKKMIKSALTVVSITSMAGNVFFNNNEEFDVIEKNGHMVLDREHQKESQSAIVCDIVSHDSVGFEYDNQWRVCQNSHDYTDYVIIENEKGMNEGDKYIVELEHDDLVGMEKGMNKIK